MRTCLAVCLVGLVPTQSPGVRLRHDKQDRVVAADYYGKPGGLVKSGLHRRPHLTALSIMYGTELNRADIQYVGTLTGLVDLELGCVELDGEFVAIEGDLRPLRSLTKLKRLVLHRKHMRDEDLLCLTRLPALRTIELASGTRRDAEGLTDKSGEILSRVASLRELRVVGNKNHLTDHFISRISRLPRLEYLAVGSEKFTDASLGLIALRLQTLAELEISSGGFTDRGVRYLHRLKQLRALRVASKRLKGDCVKSLHGLRRLRQLELTVSGVDDDGFAGLAALPRLEMLALRRPALTDKQFAMLRNHRTLQVAFLNGAKLSRGNVRRIRDTLPGVHLGLGSIPPTD